jgi:hypothetical protein
MEGEMLMKVLDLVSAMKVLDLISALAGAGGTAFLYMGTFGLVALGPYTSKQLEAEVAEGNERRLLLQRIGLGLLMVSFLCSFLHAVIEWVI